MKTHVNKHFIRKKAIASSLQQSVQNSSVQNSSNSSVQNDANAKLNVKPAKIAPSNETTSSEFNDVNMKNQRIINVGNPREGFDATNVTYVQTYAAKYFQKKGDAEGETIKKVGSPRQNDDAATKGYVDTRVDNRIRQLDLRPIRMLYFSSFSTGAFAPGPILNNVSLLYCYVSGAKSGDIKVYMSVLRLGESQQSKIELVKSGNQFTIGHSLDTFSYISFEVTPPQAQAIGLTLYYQQLVA